MIANRANSLCCHAGECFLRRIAITLLVGEMRERDKYRLFAARCDVLLVSPRCSPCTHVSVSPKKITSMRGTSSAHELRFVKIALKSNFDTACISAACSYASVISCSSRCCKNVRYSSTVLFFLRLLHRAHAGTRLLRSSVPPRLAGI